MRGELALAKDLVEIGLVSCYSILFTLIHNLWQVVGFAEETGDLVSDRATLAGKRRGYRRSVHGAAVWEIVAVDLFVLRRVCRLS